MRTFTDIPKTYISAPRLEPQRHPNSSTINHSVYTHKAAIEPLITPIMNSFRIFSQRLRPALNGRMATQELVSAYGPTVFKGLAVAGIGGAVISQLMRKADADSGEPKKIFPRPGPSFTRLTLEKAEDVNHNTKRLRFALPEENAVTGLPLTCELKCHDLEPCEKSRY